MMRADEGFQSDQAGGRLASFHQWHASVCRVKLDPNALIKKRYVGILTVKHIQSRWRPNGNIAIRQKSGVPSRSTVNRTFIAVLRSCQCSPDNPDFMITALD